MTNKKITNSPTGPQGTQMFDLADINKMIAEEIIQSQPADANTPAIIGVSTNVSGLQFVLNKDKLEVGRRPNSDIKLEDASVSSMHAQIIREGEHWKVLNLLSSNGTFVNGEKFTEKYLEPGDRIAFGGVEFVFTYIHQLEQGVQASKNSAAIIAAIALVIAFAGLLYFII